MTIAHLEHTNTGAGSLTDPSARSSRIAYFRSNTAGPLAITPLILTYTLYVPAPDSELVARLYMYLQSTIRKRALLSWGWIVSGSFTGPVGLSSVFVTTTDAGCVGHVAVKPPLGDGVKVSV